jgi:hypothetical protein
VLGTYYGRVDYFILELFMCGLNQDDVAFPELIEATEERIAVARESNIPRSIRKGTLGKMPDCVTKCLIIDTLGNHS